MDTTEDPFEALLNWLNCHDRDAAGQTYELIRTGLVQVLISRGFSNAEDLADDTIERVTRKVPEIAPTYKGQPARYFFGVLRNVIKEQGDVKEIATDDFKFISIKTPETSDAYDCLIECLAFLPEDKSETILDYYTYTGSEKIKAHNEMAEKLGISENALRIRAYRIRATLEKCVHKCLSKTEIKSLPNPLQRKDQSLSRLSPEHGSS